MTDREYLELAAKAAGIVVVAPDEYEISAGGKGGLLISGYGACDHWNPLTDDGDALRLAVSLLFEIDMGRGCVAIRHSTGIKILEAFNHDPYAASRRAIVRAASEIGRSMT